MSLQKVVGCDDVGVYYSDHLWLAVEEEVVGAGGRGHGRRMLLVFQWPCRQGSKHYS